jgi:putative ABC transport system permease protein
MRAMLRWISSDLRAHLGQVIVEVLVVGGVLTALLLSATVLDGATNPWRGLFAQTTGAEIWMHLAPGTRVRGLRQIAGVNIAGPYTTTSARIVQGQVESAVELRAMTPKMPQVGRLLLRKGKWLSHKVPDGVVLEYSFAQAIHATVGSVLVISQVGGRTVRAPVIGIAATSDQGFYPSQTPGLAWVQRPLLRRVVPVGGPTEELIGIRTSDLAQTSAVEARVEAELPGLVWSVSTWTQVEQSMVRGDPLLGLLLALFGLVALGGAVLVIATATGGRVLAQLEDLATLKTLGFTPAQVTAMVVAEHAMVGFVGAGLGVAAAWELTFPLLRGIPTTVVQAVAPLPVPWIAVIVGAAEFLVVLAAAFPAWRAGRVSGVVAVRRPLPAGHLSRLARLAMWSRFPPAIVLGARAAFVRRLPAALTVGGLGISMAVITIGLGVAATVDGLQRNPADIGLAATVTVSPGELTPGQAARIVDSDREVKRAYPSVQVTAQLATGTTITTLGLGTSARPYPFHVIQGHIYHAPLQAVASQGLFDQLHLKLGHFEAMEINRIPVEVQIVGRIVEPEYNDQVLAYGLDTLGQDGVVSPPVYYSLVLRPGVTASEAQNHLLAVSGGRLDVTEITDPASQLGIIRPMLTGLIAVLALVGLASILTASVVGIRDQSRDVGALRAIGLTPRQVMASLISSTAALAVMAVGAGAIAGLLVSTRLINLGAQLYGIGSGIGRPPSAEVMAVAILVAVTGATLTAVVPARRVAAIPVATMLRP